MKLDTSVFHEKHLYKLTTTYQTKYRIKAFVINICFKLKKKIFCNLYTIMHIVLWVIFFKLQV